MGRVGVWDVPPLIDGGLVTVPRGGFFDLNGEWRVENEALAPDIEVRQIPADVIAGRDPQLEAAVAEAMRLLETESVRLLTEPEPPVRVRRPGKRGLGPVCPPLWGHFGGQTGWRPCILTSPLLHNTGHTYSLNVQCSLGSRT